MHAEGSLENSVRPRSHSSLRRLGPAGALAAAVALLAYAVGASARPEQGVRAKSQIVEDLYDAQFVDAHQGWVVGVFGSVYHTTDAGRHWILQETPTTQHLYGVAFADDRNGWIVGRSGEVLHTADGGAHWLEQKSGTSKHLFKVVFIDDHTGWAVGDWGVVLRTRDGGQTWEDRSLDEDQIVYGLAFADAANGWMVGEFGSIRRTRDGGETWVKQDVGTSKTFFGVATTSPMKAWAVGIDGLVARTVDGGATWTIQQGQTEMASFESLGFMDIFKNPGLYDVKMSGKNGYVVGDIGNVLVTKDGGETWTHALLPAEWRLSWIRGLSILPSGDGLLVGASGLTFWANGTEMHFSQDQL